MQASALPPSPAAVENEHRESGTWLCTWRVRTSLDKGYSVADGLRGIAILLVVGCHLFYVNPEKDTATQFIGGVIDAASVGVVVFFTLSGFLIAHPLWKRKIRGDAHVIPPGFGWRRFWKIYPPFALSIILFTPIYVARTGDFSFVSLAGQWLVGWPLARSVRGQLNPVMWSLIVEAHFYILLPLLFLCVKKVSAKGSLWVIFLTLAIVPTCFRWWNLSKGIHFELAPEIKIHFPSMLDAFVLGVLLAGFENLQLINKSWARWGDAGCVLFAAALLAISWFNLHPVADPHIQLEILTCAVKVASGLMLCYIADPSHPRARFLSSPWLCWCGLISYEWYLFHQPIILWARESLGPAHGSIMKYGLIMGGSCAMGLLISVMVYRCFSLPILRYGRNRNSDSGHSAKMNVSEVRSVS